MKFVSDFHEERFRQSVDKALQRIRTILDTTRLPRLAEEEDHKYDDKFALTELLVNTCNAACINALRRLGLTTDKFQTVLKWVHDDKQSVTLRFVAKEYWDFIKETIVEQQEDKECELEKKTTEKNSCLGIKASETTETVTIKVVTKVKERYWKVGIRSQLFIYKGSDPNDESSFVELEANETSIIIIKDSNNRKNSESLIDVNLTWLFQQLSPVNQQCQFYIDRATEDARTKCKTPRRNKDVDDAMNFYKKLHSWANNVSAFFCLIGLVYRSRFLMVHDPTVEGERNSKFFSRNALRDIINVETVFVPVVPLMEKGSILPMTDINSFLKEHMRSLDQAIEDLSSSYPSPLDSCLLSVTEATIVLVTFHLKCLTQQCSDALDYMEHMLQKQLIKAIGKEVHSNDFDDFMRFYIPRFFHQDFAPRPFTYAIRRPHHFPDGILSIERKPSDTGESNEIQPIETWVRHVAGATAPPMFLPINAATTIELRGDRYLHGWMQHVFESSKQPPSFQLAARARQFSSFILIVGTMMGPNKMDPKHALVLQNKDQVLIPLLTNTLPSAKQFKSAISSLSPEQQDFAKAFRALQLESTIFAVCVIQLKPQLERLLGLPEGSLTKEIQLTQDLMSLFVEYQIPSSMLSYDDVDGNGSAGAVNKVVAVKGYVKSVLDVIDSEKRKRLMEEEMKAHSFLEMCREKPPNELAYEHADFTWERSKTAGNKAEEENLHWAWARNRGLPPGLDEPEPEFYESRAGEGCRSPEHPMFDWGRNAPPPGHEEEHPEFEMCREKPSDEVPDEHPVFDWDRSGPPNVQEEVHPEFDMCPIKADFDAPDDQPDFESSPHEAIEPIMALPEASNDNAVQELQDGFSEAAQNLEPPKDRSKGKQDKESNPVEQNVDTFQQVAPDFTAIPKMLDGRMEHLDTDNALHSTIIKTGPEWQWQQSDLLSTETSTTTWSLDDMETPKKSAIDLLDAISRSGTLPIECSELHVVIGLSHCFENDLMGTLLQDNINPIAKVEKSSLLLASTIHGVPATRLLANRHDVERLTHLFPQLMIEE